MSRVPVLDGTAAIEVAAELSALFAKGAAQRDAERATPYEEIAALKASGLLAITVPTELGGADVSVATLTEVFRLLAAGDPSIAQIPHSHFVYVNQLKHQGTPAQQARLLTDVLAGKSFGNAQSEIGTKHVRDHRTTLVESGDGGWLLTGDKGYCTGALFADWIPVLAHKGVYGPMVVAWVRRDAEGVEVVDDWAGMGQRTTASGTVTLRDVAVSDELITGYSETFTGPQTYGAFAQVLHSALDAGIARTAITEAAEFVSTKSRPYPDAGVARAAEDPLIVQAFGQMELSVRGCELLLAAAANAVDEAVADLTEQSAGAASLAVAAARAATTDAAVSVSSRLFEVAGTRSVLEALNLNRHWRNARTHTLHDPAAWKLQHLGRYALEGVLPPNHGQL